MLLLPSTDVIPGYIDVHVFLALGSNCLQPGIVIGYWALQIGIGSAFVIELFTFVAAGRRLIYDPLPGINEP